MVFYVILKSAKIQVAQVLSVVKSIAEKSWGKVMQTDHIRGTLYETIYSVIHKQGDKQGDRHGDYTMSFTLQDIVW